MARYFYHLYNDIEAPDLEGRDLPDDQSARDAAVTEAREMMTESVREGRLDLNHKIEVADVFRRVLFTVRYGEAVRVTPLV